jgi:MFS superfamily sulfate permease-like transporter
MDITDLQKSYYLVPIATVLCLCIMYAIDTVDKGKYDKKSCYTKSAVTTAIIVGIIVYIHRIIPSIEEVITSPPPF